jgi:cytochrome c oxidase subunit 2
MMTPLKGFANRILGMGTAAIAALSAGVALADIDGQPKPGQIDLPAGATVIAHELAGFHTELLVIITFITLFVLGLLAYVSLRYRRAANPTPSRTTHNTLIEVIWTAVPVMILAVIALPSFKLLYYMDRTEKPEMTVKITGHQWYWSYELPGEKIDDYQSELIPDDKIDASHIRLLSVDYPLVVPVGTNIQLLFAGADVIHSWLVADLGVQKSAFPGRLNESWMNVDQEGVYYGQCTQICGDRHGYMPIEVHAVSKEKFAQWVDLVQHSTAKDKMRDANEKVLGLSYVWEDQPAKTAAAEPASAAKAAASEMNIPASDANIIVSR